MTRRRGSSGLSGILLVDKPEGVTSHDVVDRVRRAAGERRVGHAGTLDPMATGLLVVLVGPATRLAPYLTAADKTYLARIAFGTATDTDDADGEPIRTAEVPAELFTLDAARELLAGFLGESMQAPPAYSAIKVDGRVSHRVARGGETPELAPRPVTVHAAAVRAVDAQERTWDVEFTVSKGTYIRALARDIGERAGSAAHLTALRRTASGQLALCDAHSLEELALAGTAGRIAELFANPADALPGLPRVEAEASAVLSGRPIPCPDLQDPAASDPAGRPALYAVYVDGNRLAALYRPGGEGRLVPEVVLATPLQSAGGST